MPKLSLGVIGCGRVFERFHLPAIENSTRWRLTAVTDPSAERRAWAEKRISGIHIFGSAAEMMESVRPEGVLVASPPPTHAQMTLGAVASGAHVLVEKPMALSVEDAANMAAAARRAGKVLQIGFNRRFRASYRKFKSIISGLPNARAAGLDHTLVLDASGWKPYSGYLSRNTQGEEVIDDVVPHQADLASWLFDAPPQRVRASVEGGDGRRIALTLLLGNGVRVNCMAAHGRGYREYGVLTSDRGVFFLFPTGVLALGASPSKRHYQIVAIRDRLHSAACRLFGRPTPTALSFRAQWEAFADAVGGVGNRDGCRGEEGLQTVALATACRRSIESGGEWITIEAAQEISR